jgi:hypothetical protein
MPLVSCFYVSGSSLERPYVEKDMAKQQARLKEINFYTLEDPIGTVVLSYMWGAVPTEKNISTWKEYWMTVGRRDFYTDVTACIPGDFHYSTIEELVRQNLVQRDRNTSDNPRNRAAKNWQERTIRFRE